MRKGERTLWSCAVFACGSGRGRIVRYDLGSQFLERLAPGFDEDVCMIGLFDGGEGDE